MPFVVLQINTSHPSIQHMKISQLKAHQSQKATTLWPNVNLSANSPIAMKLTFFFVFELKQHGND
jgi:hypothetical protein